MVTEMMSPPSPPPPPTNVAVTTSPPPLRLLIIDNYDSYTHNLTLYFNNTTTTTTTVVTILKNDQLPLSTLLQEVLPHYNGIILSPGPGRPGLVKDFGVCRGLLESEVKIPILGVCLGMQGLGEVFGGKVIPAPQPMHGLLSEVIKTPPTTSLRYDLLEGLPDSFKVVRYHSLVVDPTSLPSTLAPLCTVKGEPTLMGLAHTSLPYFGVQYHPESVATEWGAKLLDNFAKIATSFPINPKFANLPDFLRTSSTIQSTLLTNPTPVYPFQLQWSKLTDRVTSGTLFDTLYSQDPHSFWLDSGKYRDQGWSYMGPRSHLLQYDLVKKLLRVTQSDATSCLWEGHLEGTFFDWLESLLGHCQPEITTGTPPGTFWGGPVGYFGYEMKLESLPKPSDLNHLPPLPYFDCQFLFANRLLAFDHTTNSVWAVALVRTQPLRPESTTRDAQALARDLPIHFGLSSIEFEDWVQSTQSQISQLPSHPPPPPTIKGKVATSMLNTKLDLDESRYLESVRTSQDLIRLGETYEVCLTTQVRTTLPHPPTPLGLFKELRDRNPAPFSALLQFPDVVVCSSSPERFIQIDPKGNASMKPIKGTVSKCSLNELRPQFPDLDETQLLALVEQEDRRRAHDLATDIKQRAENLMIVDLIRNDLATFCDPPSVHVPSLMHVETYATVHQLVTTIEARLRPGMGRATAIRHCFPPGSMTGAPKLRTVQILESLEPSRRGIYSGVTGYFSLGGHVDLAVVIRTILLSGSEFRDVSIGAGGAIVALSDPDDELAEMQLKAQSTLPSLAAYLQAHPPLPSTTSPHRNR